ncbi:ketosteroid isomerase-like protein [Bradyrhizobium sp. F1.4.3]|uniref:nuclear transport factor 2 family protein n=1 Tax=Bradyrhizobium sp. F1.4.3 TaxID=3156356 RepID=UPI0033937CBA
MAMMTEQILQAFADAWNRHDIDALMSFMTEDCVFEANAGPDVVGTSFHGYKDVRHGFQRAWQIYPDARWTGARHFVSGDRGASEWIFSGTAKSGARIEVAGCDLFRFRGDKIVVKNSFRKQRG